MNKIVYSQQTMFLHRTRYKNDFPFLLPLHKEQAARIPKRSRDTLFISLLFTHFTSLMVFLLGKYAYICGVSSKKDMFY